MRVFSKELSKLCSWISPRSSTSTPMAVQYVNIDHGYLNITYCAISMKKLKLQLPKLMKTHLHECTSANLCPILNWRLILQVKHVSLWFLAVLHGRRGGRVTSFQVYTNLIVKAQQHQLLLLNAFKLGPSRVQKL
jgi:hypothetical protein